MPGAGNDPLAGVALALGVASIPAAMCCGGLAVVLNVVGLVLAIIAFRKATGDAGAGSKKTLAIAAIIVNVLVLSLSVALIGFFVFVRMGAGKLFP